MNEDVVARFRGADLPSRRGFLRRPAAAGGFIVDCEQSPLIPSPCRGAHPRLRSSGPPDELAFFVPDPLECGLETPDIDRPGPLGALDQSSWIPELDRRRFVAGLWGARGPVPLDGETDCEYRAVVGVVDVEIGVDEFHVLGGRSQAGLLPEFPRRAESRRLVDFQDAARYRPGVLVRRAGTSDRRLAEPLQGWV